MRRSMSGIHNHRPSDSCTVERHQTGRSGDLRREAIKALVRQSARLRGRRFSSQLAVSCILQQRRDVRGEFGVFAEPRGWGIRPARAPRRSVAPRNRLGPVGIHREFITAAAKWIIEAKLWSVLSARIAMRLNSLSLAKKFSMRCRHLYISSSMVRGRSEE